MAESEGFESPVELLVLQWFIKSRLASNIT